MQGPGVELVSFDPTPAIPEDLSAVDALERDIQNYLFTAKARMMHEPDSPELRAKIVSYVDSFLRSIKHKGFLRNRYGVRVCHEQCTPGHIVPEVYDFETGEAIGFDELMRRRESGGDW